MSPPTEGGSWRRSTAWRWTHAGITAVVVSFVLSLFGAVFLLESGGDDPLYTKRPPHLGGTCRTDVALEVPKAVTSGVDFPVRLVAVDPGPSIEVCPIKAELVVTSLESTGKASVAVPAPRVAGDLASGGVEWSAIAVSPGLVELTADVVVSTPDCEVGTGGHGDCGHQTSAPVEVHASVKATNVQLLFERAVDEAQIRPVSRHQAAPKTPRNIPVTLRLGSGVTPVESTRVRVSSDEPHVSVSFDRPLPATGPPPPVPLTLSVVAPNRHDVEVLLDVELTTAVDGEVVSASAPVPVTVPVANAGYVDIFKENIGVLGTAVTLLTGVAGLQIWSRRGPDRRADRDAPGERLRRRIPRRRGSDRDHP